MDADAFSRAVDDGLRLSKRIYAGKDRYATSAPARAVMERSRTSDLLPTASMVYAVFVDPTIVDNPDIPSYLPYVHGRCDPPALIPLQMKGVEVAVDCHVGVAEVAGPLRDGEPELPLLAGGPRGRADGIEDIARSKRRGRQDVDDVAPIIAKVESKLLDFGGGRLPG